MDTIDEVKEVAKMMCGKHLVFPSGHSEGLLVNCVLVMEYIQTKQNYFLSI